MDLISLLFRFQFSQQYRNILVDMPVIHIKIFFNSIKRYGKKINDFVESDIRIKRLFITN